MPRCRAGRPWHPSYQCRADSLGQGATPAFGGRRDSSTIAGYRARRCRAYQNRCRTDRGPVSAAPVCRDLLAKAKRVTLRTVIGQNDVLNASLKSGELDLVIGSGVGTDDDLTVHPIVEDMVVVVASKSHAIFAKRAKMADLVKYAWVLAAPSVESRQWLDLAFDRWAQPRPNPQIETNLVHLLAPLIAQTGLLSFMSRRHLSPARAGSVLKEVPLKETTMRRLFAVMYRKDSYLPPAAHTLIDLLCEKGDKLFQED